MLVLYLLAKSWYTTSVDKIIKMKKIIRTIQSLSYQFYLIIFVAIFVIASYTPNIGRVEAASTTASFTVSPSSGTFRKGSTFALKVNVSLANKYNASWADLYFNSSRFQYISTTFGSAYNGGGTASLKSNAYGSYISLAATRTSGGPLNGSYALASINFKALSTGGAYANFGSKRVVLYPTTEYTTASTNGNYTVTNPVTPPATTPNPTPTPSPTPTPAPTPAPAPTPTPPKPAPRAKAPVQSKPSRTGLLISDFTIGGLGYNSANLSWKTNKPASSKANFSTDKADLSHESLDNTATTDHSITLGGDDLQAGNHYYVRITSDDGSGPVTIDGEFDTKYIPVIIKVTDTNSNPIDSATITVGDSIGISDSDGQAPFDLKQGEVSIHASKNELSTDFTAQIDVPAEGDPTQTITIALTDSAAPASSNQTTKNKSSSVGRIIAAFFVLLIGGGLVFFMIVRRRVSTSSSVLGDALEAENYTQPVAPPPLPPAEPITSTSQQSPDPTYGPQHHASLPELVKQHAGAEAVTSTVKQPEVAVSPTGNQIPKHASLKDLVSVPQVEKVSEEISPAPNDLPIAPAKSEHHKKTTKNNSDMPDDLLVIKH